MEALALFAPVRLDFDGFVLEEIARVCAGLDAATAEKARSTALKAIEEVEVAAAARCSLFPFVRPMLEALRAQGISLALITRNCPAAVFTVFPDAREHFACILTREDVHKVKPHPEHLLAALERLGHGTQDSLMVGDHPMDIQVGKRAGVRTAGVASGFTSCQRLAEEGPDMLAEDAGELMRRMGLWKV